MLTKPQQSVTLSNNPVNEHVKVKAAFLQGRDHYQLLCPARIFPSTTCLLTLSEVTRNVKTTNIIFSLVK